MENRSIWENYYTVLSSVDMNQEGVQAIPSVSLRSYITPVLLFSPNTFRQGLNRPIWEWICSKDFHHQMRQTRGILTNHGGSCGHSPQEGGVYESMRTCMGVTQFCNPDPRVNGKFLNPTDGSKIHILGLTVWSLFGGLTAIYTWEQNKGYDWDPRSYILFCKQM